MSLSLMRPSDDADAKVCFDALLQAAQAFLGQPSCRMASLELCAKVADETEKLLICAPSGRPLAFIEWSAAVGPGEALRAARQARLARLALGDALGEPVVVPHHLGTFDGRSATVAPYHRAWPQLPVVRRLCRPHVARAALAWHYEVVRHTARSATAREVREEFSLPLRDLAVHPAVSAQVREAAARASSDLDAGLCKPSLVLWHGDFWYGNLMRPPPDARYGMVVIDWGGSRAAGPGIYDTLCMASSAGLRVAALRRELDRHANALGCRPAHVDVHLLASLGWLSRHLGQWPVERFAEKCDQVLELLRAAQA